MALSWANAAWVASTPYGIGARVVADSGKVYAARIGGTSAASGGPTGTSTGIVDGGVTWDYIGLATAFTVAAVAPELATTPAASQALLLEAVQLQVNPDEFGDSADLAAAYLAAHMATLLAMQGRGPILSETLGPMSASYGSMLTFGALGLTSYGLEYRRLVRLTPAALGIVS